MYGTYCTAFQRLCVNLNHIENPQSISFDYVGQSGHGIWSKLYLFFTLNAATITDMNLVTIDVTAGYFGCLGMCDSLSDYLEETLQGGFSLFFN